MLLSVCLSVRLSVCRQNAYPKTRFSQKLRSLELWSLLSTYNKSYKEPIIKPLKSKTAEIRHLENGDDYFSALHGPTWMKFHRLVQNDMPTVVI